MNTKDDRKLYVEMYFAREGLCTVWGRERVSGWKDVDDYCVAFTDPFFAAHCKVFTSGGVKYFSIDLSYFFNRAAELHKESNPSAWVDKGISDYYLVKVGPCLEAGNWAGDDPKPSCWATFRSLEVTWSYVTGLVGYWRFDEGLGARAYDSSAFCNVGTVYGATWADGKYRTALNFDGVDDYVEVSSSTIGTSNEMTITLWTKPGIQTLGAFNDHKDIIRSQCYGGGMWGISTRSGFNTNNRLAFQIGWISGADTWWELTDAIAVKNEWNHLVLVLDRNAGKATFYRNGQYIDETKLTVSTKPATTGLHIASDCAGPFNGTIDEVKIYSRVLSAEEIRAEFQGSAGHWKFDEGAGTVAHDSSANKNDGTIYGATWTTGKCRNALNFDGVDDYVNVPDSPSLDITDAITIRAWVRFNAFTMPQYAIVHKWVEPHGYVLEVTNYDGYYKPRITIHTTSGYATCISPIALQPNVWYHLAGTYDSSTDELKIYVNGKESNSLTHSGTIHTNNGPLTIGKRSDSDGDFMNGKIDEVKIYNRALSQQEIMADIIILLCDTNCDGKVDMKDIYACILAFGSKPGHPKWNPACDIIFDNVVNIKDVYAAIRNFGRACP